MLNGVKSNTPISEPPGIFFHGEKYKSCPRSVLFLFNSGYSRDDLDSEALNLTNNISSPISVTLHHCEQVM
jgi:hypothetical protein